MNSDPVYSGLVSHTLIPRSIARQPGWLADSTITESRTRRVVSTHRFNGRPCSSELLHGGQPAFTQPRPPTANPADVPMPQPAGTSVSDGLMPPSASNTPLFTAQGHASGAPPYSAPGHAGSTGTSSAGGPPLYGYSGTQPQQQPPPPRKAPSAQSQSSEASLHTQSLSTSPATDVAGDGSVLTNRPHPLQLQALRTEHQALPAAPSIVQDWLGHDFAMSSRTRREVLDKQTAKASLSSRSLRAEACSYNSLVVSVFLANGSGAYFSSRVGNRQVKLGKVQGGSLLSLVKTHFYVQGGSEI